MRSVPGDLRALVLAAASLLPAMAVATDWHVAPGGVDGAAGSEAAPLATLAHAVGRAASGDRIRLQRGGTYRVGVLDLGSGLQLEAYGEGEAPTVTGSAPLTLTGSWAENGNVLTAAAPQAVLACYVDGHFQPLARYPNTGFLRVDNDDSPDQIVDAELLARPGVAAGRWTGAQVRWRRWSWWWETRPIVDHGPADTLALGPEGRFQDGFSDPGSGYFIDSSLAELDAPGEWLWQDGTLYLYPPADADPLTMQVEVITAQDPGLITRGTSLTGLRLARFFGPALRLDGPGTVDRCRFEEIETDAVRFSWNAQPFTIRNTVFLDVRNIAIAGWADAAGPTGTLIERNLFHRIGVERGYGGSGSWHAAGVILGQTHGAVFRLNRVVDTGYAGIILGSDGQTVERNVFVRTMGTLNDGAAVYTNCNASTIRDNIILDTIGDLETSHPWWPLGHGIWPEFLSDFRDSIITGNTIYGSNGQGIMLPNNFHCTVSDNRAVDNRVAGLGLSGEASDQQDHTLAGNVLAAVAPTRRLQRPENLNQWWLPPYTPPTPVALQYDPALDYGAMTATTLVASASEAALIRPEGGTDLDSIAAWTAAASWADGTDSRVVRGTAYLLFNDTEQGAEVPVPAGSWSLVDGTPVATTVAVAPFGSVVLVSSAAVEVDPPYTAASGIDWRASTPTLHVLGADPGGGGDAGASSDAGTARDGGGAPDAALADRGLDAGGSSADRDLVDASAGADGALSDLPGVDSARSDLAQADAPSRDASAASGDAAAPTPDHVVGEGCACSGRPRPLSSTALPAGLTLLLLLRRRRR